MHDKVSLFVVISIKEKKIISRTPNNSKIKFSFDMSYTITSTQPFIHPQEY